MPLYRIHENGVFEVRKGKFSKSWKFDDVDFISLSEEEQQAMILRYERLLSTFENDVLMKITINNKKMDAKTFRKKALMEMRNDGYDDYREDYNKMLIDRNRKANGITQEKYLTATVERDSVYDAQIVFNRIESEMSSALKSMHSDLHPIYLNERIKILHDFFRPNEEMPEDYDPLLMQEKGESPKDYIVPDAMEFDRTKYDHFRIDGRYARSMYLRNVANYLSTNFLSRLTQSDHTLMLSLNIVAIPPDEAMKEVEDKRTTVESNKISYQKKQFDNGNYTTITPFSMQQEEKDTNEWTDDLSNRDQQMYMMDLQMVVQADTKNDLEQVTENMQNVAKSARCQLGTCVHMQLQGLNDALPWGTDDCFRFYRAMRTSEGAAAFMPLTTKEICHDHGICYGTNKISKNLIIVNRDELANGNSFIFGQSGFGKSFTAKNEIVSILLAEPDADVIVIDPEREYTKIAQTFNGALIRLSNTSENHINALDINKDYSEGSADPIPEKSDFVLSFCAQIVGQDHLGPAARSLIDSSLQTVYADYKANGYTGTPPTLIDLVDDLKKQDNAEAQDLATALELYSTGSLSTFAKQTNVDVDNRFIVYDIRDLGENLAPVGMLVVLDSILNRITANKERGKKTYIFIDEIYLLFKQHYSAQFVSQLWKRVRKYNAVCTGITQDVADLLQDHYAEVMLTNSEFIIMLSLAATNRARLVQLLNISPDQERYITDADVANGLIKVGSSIVPFSNTFPKNKLYGLMHTDPKEKEMELEDLEKKWGRKIETTPLEEPEMDAWSEDEYESDEEESVSEDDFSDTVDIDPSDIVMQPEAEGVTNSDKSDDVE